MITKLQYVEFLISRMTNFTGTHLADLIADDSVQHKRSSRFIELVKRQYSGTEHGLVHSSGAASDFYPIDHRIYAPETDGKTKNTSARC
jgi:hypothetical protein